MFLANASSITYLAYLLATGHFLRVFGRYYELICPFLQFEDLRLNSLLYDVQSYYWKVLRILNNDSFIELPTMDQFYHSIHGSL